MTELVSALRVPADLESLAFVRAAIGASLAREGWGGEPAARVILAANEAVVNAIEHGSEAGAAIDVELSMAPERVLLVVADAGRPGAPAPLTEPAVPHPASPRGRGRLIMQAVSDRFEIFARGDGGCEVRLEFARAGSA